MLDHLGSTAVIMDATGAVSQRLAYDPWGKRRNADGSDDTAGTIRGATNRGFTSHEHIDDVGLINMNARIYDPQIGRFMSADPVTATPYDAQSLSRYTYVDNRPLSLTDLTGLSWDGSTLRSDVPAFDTGMNVQNTQLMDKAMRDNMSLVRPGYSEEKVVFLQGDRDNGPITVRTPGDAVASTDGAADQVESKSRKGDIAIIHSHLTRTDGMIDYTREGTELGDAQPVVRAGLPTGTVHGQRLGVREIVNGGLQFRMLEGTLSQHERQEMQKNLDDEQRQLNMDKFQKKLDAIALSAVNDMMQDTTTRSEAENKKDDAACHTGSGPKEMKLNTCGR